MANGTGAYRAEMALPPNSLFVDVVQLMEIDGEEVFGVVIERDAPQCVKDVAARSHSTQWSAGRPSSIPTPVIEEFDVSGTGGVRVFFRARTADGDSPEEFTLVFNPLSLFAYLATNYVPMVLVFNDGMSHGWSCDPDGVRFLLEQHDISIPDQLSDV